jgi:HlyD family type I secretion membrane fusion protein
MSPAPRAVPLSIRGQALLGLVIILVLFGGFGAWAALAPLAGGVVAGGRITVDSNLKAVQHLEGGIVQGLLVRNGDLVEAGQVLIRLDPTRARASLETIQANLDADEVLYARLLAERDGQTDLVVPEAFAGRLDAPKIRRMLDSQRRLMVSRRTTLEGQVSILEQRTGQLGEQLQGLEIQVKAMDRQLSLIEEELAGLRELFAKGFTERTRILALEREAARLEGERGANLATIAETKKAIGEANLQIIQLRQTFTQQVLTESREVETRIFELRERVVAARHVLAHIDIRAPTDGIVAEMAVHTEGGVIRPGDTVLKLVPIHDRLLIEANIRPTDIDNVFQGQQALITLSAFSQRTTPTLNGHVEYVSADSLEDRTTGENYYVARVSVPDTEVARLNGRHLLPGMPAEVMIKTETRTPVEYLLKPLNDSLRRAWREE